MKKASDKGKASEGNKVYTEYVKQKDPKTNVLKTVVLAFCIGGLICMVGQGVRDIIKLLDDTLDREQVSKVVTGIMIFLGATLTGLGIYDDIGKIAGAGSIVPITGFANSVVSPAMEFKTEGIVYGVESKMFIIAGPVIVSGIVGSALVGLIYYIIGLF